MCPDLPMALLPLVLLPLVLLPLAQPCEAVIMSTMQYLIS